MACAPRASVRRRLVAVAGAAVMLVALAACAGHSDADRYFGGHAQDGELTREDLVARPALEDVVATYDEMLTEMRSALSEDFVGTWAVGDPAGGGPAGDTADGVEASFASSPVWVLDVSTSGSAEDKQQAVDAITPIAQRYGFPELAVFLDRDGEIQAVAQDAMGASLRFGSVIATTLTYTTGTHYTLAEMLGTKESHES